ncbi:MAG: FtsQ-type POTRA domain-containing protein [bacterium]|nr:FtsQ-type POTRA domain-containing protein [bacterium]
MNLLGRKSKRAKRMSRLERRIPVKKSRSGWVKRTLILSILSTLIVGGYFAYAPVCNFLSHQKMFTINEVTFSGNPHIDNQYLLSLLPPIVGENLLALNVDYLKGTLMLHPWVQNAQIHRRLPNRVAITIEEKKPVALLNADRLMAVDLSGLPLNLDSRKGSLDVPLINCPKGNTIKAGRPISDKRILNLLPHLEALHQRLPELWALISEISWDDQNQVVMISTLSQAQILLGNEPTWQQMLNLYSFMLYQGSRTGMDNLNHVDLRFPGRVVVRRNPVEAAKSQTQPPSDKRAS